MNETTGGAFAGQLAQAGLMQNVFSVGARAASSIKPITIGMKVLITANRPYLPGVVIEVAGRYKDDIEFALVRRSVPGWFGEVEKDEWESVYSLAPIGTEAECNGKGVRP